MTQVGAPPAESPDYECAESDEFDGGYWVSESTDGGANWKDIWYSDQYGPNALLIDPAGPADLYAGAGGGLIKSDDGGATWNNIGQKNANATTLAMDPANATLLYAATAGAYPGAGLSMSPV